MRVFSEFMQGTLWHFSAARFYYGEPAGLMAIYVLQLI